MGHDRRVPALSVRVDDDPAARRPRDRPASAAAVRARGRATLAVSGGSTGPACSPRWPGDAAVGRHRHLAGRRARRPDGDPDRNANQLDGVPGRAPPDAGHRAGPRAAAAAYAAGLPDRFDVVHLGMGPDGHTASWPPGDPVIASSRPVDLAGRTRARCA
jgi:6-phosphogluconolactonase